MYALVVRRLQKVQLRDRRQCRDDRGALFENVLFNQGMVVSMIVGGK